MPNAQDAAPLVFDAIGTRWQIDIDGPLSPDRRSGLLRLVLDRIAVFDKDWSRFRDDSLVSRMARQPGVYTLPDDAPPMFDIYRTLYDLTGGKFTPLIGQVLVDAGYDAAYSLRPGTPKAPPTWEASLRYEHPRLEVKQSVLLDFGAAGKGYLIDIIGGVLEGEGVRSYCIDAGQDMLYRSEGRLPLRVGLENPADVTQAIGVMTITGGSICGSAGNRRQWADYHHIIDPHSLRSPRHIQACWTTARTALVADAMSTALYFAEPSLLQTRFDFEYCILRPDFTIDRSRGFDAELFVS